MADGINFSNLSQKVQEYIQKNNIDADKSGTIDKTELANLLSAVAAEGEVRGDSFAPERGNISIPTTLPQNIKNLANVILDIHNVRAEDNALFENQIERVRVFLKDLKEKGNIDESQISDFLALLNKNGEQYEEKVTNRYKSMGEAISQTHNYELNRPLKEEAEKTKEIIIKHTKEQQAIMVAIYDTVHNGEFEKAKDLCNALLTVTNKFKNKMSTAMTNLENYGIKAINDATQEKKDIFNLADTIRKIKEEVKADMVEFEKFEAFIQDQIVKIDDYINSGINKDELEKNLGLMTDTLVSKVEEFAGRYDNVLDAFGQFDVDTNESLKTVSEEVSSNKDEATKEFQNHNETLKSIVMKMMDEINNGQKVQELAKMLINELSETRISNDEAMTTLQAKALDFLVNGLPAANDNMTAALNVPQYNGRNIDVTPKKIEHNGEIIVIKPIQVNGEWVVQITPINGSAQTFGKVEDFPQLLK